MATAKPLCVVSALALAVLLAGCSDGVEINSKLLDSVGSISGLGGAKKETHMTERAGLVVPPPMADLPEPGSGDKVAAAVSASLPQDPETVKARSAEQQKAAKAEACKSAQMKKDQNAIADNCEGLLAKIWGSQ